MCVTGLKRRCGVQRREMAFVAAVAPRDRSHSFNHAHLNPEEEARNEEDNKKEQDWERYNDEAQVELRRLEA